MNKTCIYTDMEHNAFIWYLRILGLFSTPTCFFVIYMIWKHSPKNVGTYRGYLLCYAVSGTCMDIYFTIVANPVLFLPEMAGYTRGLMQYFPRATTATVYFFYCNLGVVLMSTVMLLMHQFRAMLPQYIVPCWTKKTNLVVYIGFLVFMVVVLIYSIITDTGFFQTNELRRGSEQFPCLIPMFKLPTAIYFEVQYAQTGVYSFVTLGTCFALFCSIASILTVTTLNRITKPTSAKTAAMHKRFLKRLLLQVAIPYLLVIVPFVIHSYITIFGKDLTFEYLGDIFISMVAAHGFVSSIAILLANEHYFKMIKGSDPISFNEIEISTIT